jgi:hypothetical protein
MTKKATNAQIVKLLEIIATELQEQGERLRRIEALQRPAGPHPSDRELLAKLDREAARPAPLREIGGQ